MPIDEYSYGTLPSGAEVRGFYLRNPTTNVSAKILNYGGIITNLHVPDRSGACGDIALGLQNLEDYIEGNAYMGTLIGPIAGRVSDGVYKTAEQRFELIQNEEPNHLHGGPPGLSRALWKVEEAADENGCPFLRLSHTIPDGSNGYPGDLNVTLIYRLTEDSGLRIEVEAKANRTTLFAPTHHAYFNLSAGSEETIAKHEVKISADSYVPIDENYRLQGRAASVMEGINDFRSGTQIGEVMREMPTHGDMYLLSDHRTKELRKVASAAHHKSGRAMEVFTTEPCLQFYTGRFLDLETTPSNHSARIPAYAALCFECQGYPDSPFEGTPSAVLEPNERFRSVTEYRFQTIQTT